MPGLNGLTGLAGLQVFTNDTPEATPEQRLGGPADPRHGNWGEQARPYSWESANGMGGSHGPFGPENQLLSDTSYFWEEGGMADEDPSMDRTPNIATKSHGAPWPSGIASGPVPSGGPDDIASNRVQSMALHGLNTNASIRSLTSPMGEVQNDTWAEIWNVTPGHSDLVPLPKQAMSSGFMWGTRDRTQSMARQNEFGFDSAHMHRRVATGSIPGNTYWMRPGGRPMAKSVAGPARPPIGVDSPFYGDDLGQAFSPQGAVLLNTPTEYNPPAQPNLQSSTPQYTGDDSVVEWY
jgi:hypothetical protein